MRREQLIEAILVFADPCSSSDQAREETRLRQRSTPQLVAELRDWLDSITTELGDPS